MCSCICSRRDAMMSSEHLLKRFKIVKFGNAIVAMVKILLSSGTGLGGLLRRVSLKARVGLIRVVRHSMALRSPDVCDVEISGPCVGAPDRRDRRQRPCGQIPQAVLVREDGDLIASDVWLAATRLLVSPRRQRSPWAVSPSCSSAPFLPIPLDKCPVLNCGRRSLVCYRSNSEAVGVKHLIYYLGL